ncbi:DUF1707 SHOCT-like domain-containing protein [Amycolatopsis sacchari]|uniref:DUF1707 SHOCT-like domain-containing protein n=1 Tax=Amycolatopsis sacchari TaxID=115433 RepID=UPI003D728DF1
MRASDADRERVAQILHNALSEGRITVAELEERLDTVYAAKTLVELEPPIADLPGVSVGKAVAPAPSHAVDTRIGGVPGSQASIAVMSGANRKGNWVVPPSHTAFAFWGGVEIDLRNARFAERHSTITAVAIMGGIDIVVPDDIVVDVNGVGLMGAFESQDHPAATATPPPGAPTVKITGFAFWGGVTVHRKPRKQQPTIEG